MPQKILAVDDQPHMLVLLERIVKERTGYEFSSTNNSLEIPGLLDSEQYDVLICDLKMPGMDGLEILDYVGRNNRREKVIIITAFGDMETAIKAMQGGAFDYITKPFKKEQILHTVDRAMNWQKLEREAITLQGMYATEPYAEAEETFRQKYVRSLAARCEDDVDRICARSGLDPEIVKKILGST